MRGSVELGNGDDVSPQRRQVDQGIIRRGLARADAQGFQPALERGYAPFEHGHSRVVDPAVAKPFSFEIEQRCCMIGTVKRIRNRLIDRDRYGLRRRIDLVATVNRNRLWSHVCCQISHDISRLISLTTHLMSDSVVRKLVTQARSTGSPPPSRTSAIQAICRSLSAARNFVVLSPSRVKQTSGSGVLLTIRHPALFSDSRSRSPMRVWCSIISMYPDSPCCASARKSFSPMKRRDHCTEVVYGSSAGPAVFPGM